jgi:hypothetical protein
MIDRADINAAFDQPLPDLERDVLGSFAVTGDPVATARLGGRRPTKKLLEKWRKDLLTAYLRHRNDIQKVFCNDLSYCDRIESNPVKLAIEIADFFISGQMNPDLHVPVPAARLAVYFVRVRFLDPFCECPDMARP